ncbi:hypothetical protein BC939DRAFT_504322 [Gamsiella multidivaricata]|uniref:uncharacterized protein n=1 Tax=Gamsiella multidivaricata TaxID=101098 RepID=UPI00221E4C3A|nr:uncharacterized protein BC939DRAFT_504322 [Gamsiella multidivaricata]KAG0370018.1 hypothetical protein BGZ54_008101 [Gamsiella multidivaricata]KAI7821531.1 hypothetical protein BC939DRAFT_504322 [Gamsiella multidivaricata]
MLPDIGKREPCKGPRDYKDLTSVVDLSMMREHVQSIRQANFDTMTYEGCGYVCRGSIRTDGFCLHLSAFKLRELRLALSNHIHSQGIDYYLTEARNMVKIQQDVTSLWIKSRFQVSISAKPV